MTEPTLPPDFILPDCARHDAKMIFRGEYDIPLAEPPATVLDIGANVGLFSVWAAQRWPQCRISAYEPIGSNVGDLEQNTAHLPRNRFTAYHSAVGSEDGIATMYFSRNRMCASLSTQDGPSTSVHLIDAAHLESAEFVKIDVEGHELVILERLDLSKTRAIAVEAHSTPLAAAVYRLLGERGFEHYRSKETVNGCHLLKFIRAGEALLAEPAIPAREPSHDATKPKVFLALPVYGGYHHFFVGPLINLLMEPPCSMKVGQCPGDSLVARARNKLAAEFLATDCTHLLFLDTDLIFTNEQIARLVSHDELIVAGLYPKKQTKLAWVLNVLDEPTEPDARGLQRIKYAGTGCLLIKREVFERMITAHPEIAYEADDGDDHSTRWDFFSCGVYQDKTGRRRYLSEDWYFCQRALDLGIPVHADVHIVLKHVGDCVYPLQDPFVPVSG